MQTMTASTRATHPRRVAATSALLAAVALVLTACGGGGGDAEAAADGEVTVEAGDMYFDPESLSAPAGEVGFVLENVGGADHDLVIEEAGDTEVAYASPGESVTGSLELDAGTYTFYCSLPGHREAGMEGTLEVE
jgi:uncharacterized cupredoxin-like copper-binding protein